VNAARFRAPAGDLRRRLSSTTSDKNLLSGRVVRRQTTRKRFRDRGTDRTQVDQPGYLPVGLLTRVDHGLHHA
jgi:hypothetical protein